ncbi:MAG: nitrous oxide reductase family maturation protein NosD [Elusimicrobia bacterium]|nr:nitrous oxide reductase family maturation protein NosD [Elusimicrobiota bacterium]
MTQAPAAGPAVNPSRRRLAAALGWAAAGLLAASLFFPYWQARLIAPQYRDGLTAKMYSYKVTGDVDEINGLNHYIGMRKLESLAPFEKIAAIPSVLALALLCGFAFWRGAYRLRAAAAAGAVFFPVAFVSDMAFWMSYATSHLDPTAPIKLKPFSIPFFGGGRVAQFHSEFLPSTGFYLAVLAALLTLGALWLSRPNAAPREPLSRKPAAGALAIALLLALNFPAGAATSLADMVAGAAPGAVVDLPAGRYDAPLVIVKPVTLRGNGRAVIDGHEQGTLITIKSPGVVLEGLVLENSGDSLLYEDSAVRVEAASAVVRGCRMSDVLFGVFLVHAPGAVIERNHMTGKAIAMGSRGDLVRSWNSDRIILRENLLEGGRDTVLWFSTGSIVDSNTVRGGRYGLHFMYTNNAVVRGNIFQGNSVGLYVMYSKELRIEDNRFENHRGPSGMALGLKESDSISVSRNYFLGNRQGVYIDDSPMIEENANAFTKNLFVYNDIGISILPGVKGNSFFSNAFVDNLQQVSLRGGGQLHGNEWSREERGNFWSDYAGYGAAGSPVGKLAYRQESAWESLMDREPLARFFLYTPAAQAVELAGRAFPVFRPKAVLTDEFPLLRPPEGLPSAPAAPAQAGVGFPLGLLSASGLLLWLPRLRRRRAAAASAPAAGVPALEASAVSKSFAGQAVLNALDVRIEAGRSVVLWGANGAGKSTFIRCLLGLHGHEGSIKIFGRDTKSEGASARAFVGYVAQEFAGYDWSVREAMEFMADLRGIGRERISPTLARCGLAGCEAKAVPQLSGGMKQKLALAQALLADPPLLVLDEPCSSLDPKSRAEFLHILQGLKGTRTILMTSHRVEEASALADLILWLEAGRPARLLSRDEFAREVGAGRPLWLELEDRSLRPKALEALTGAGFTAALNGIGIWVEAEPGRVAPMLGALAAAGISVRDLRREIAS